MSVSHAIRPDQSTDAAGAKEVRVVKPYQLDDKTPQTTGMRRLAAISQSRLGSEALWAGIMLAEPNTASSVHHHGPLETVVYVVAGVSKVRWGNRLEHEVDLETGDFVLIPPFVPHQEINPSPDKPTQWVVVRSGPESVVVELTKAPNGEYVADGLYESEASSETPSGTERAEQ